MNARSRANEEAESLQLDLRNKSNSIDESVSFRIFT